MDIAAFISDQESKLAQQTNMFDRSRLVSEVVPDSTPIDPISPSDPAFRSQIDRMLSVLREGYDEMISAFDSISPSDKWRRRAVIEFMAGEKVRDVEAKIAEQCRKVWDDAEEENRAIALGKVEEGMRYLVSLITWKTKGGK